MFIIYIGDDVILLAIHVFQTGTRLLVASNKYDRQKESLYNWIW